MTMQFRPMDQLMNAIPNKQVNRPGPFFFLSSRFYPYPRTVAPVTFGDGADGSKSDMGKLLRPR